MPFRFASTTRPPRRWRSGRQGWVPAPGVAVYGGPGGQRQPPRRAPGFVLAWSRCADATRPAPAGHAANDANNTCGWSTNPPAFDTLTVDSSVAGASVDEWAFRDPDELDSRSNVRDVDMVKPLVRRGASTASPSRRLTPGAGATGPSSVAGPEGEGRERNGRRARQRRGGRQGAGAELRADLPHYRPGGGARPGAGGPLPRAGVRGAGLPHQRGPHGDAGAQGEPVAPPARGRLRDHRGLHLRGGSAEHRPGRPRVGRRSGERGDRAGGGPAGAAGDRVRHLEGEPAG